MKTITIKMPDEIHIKLRELAKQENRSLTGQVIWMAKMAIERRKESQEEKR
jgi:predicted transcriptional regulator